MSFRASKRLFVIISILLPLHSGFAQVGQQICEVRIKTCPENLNGRTITVPEASTHLSAGIRACNLLDVLERPLLDKLPPTVIFAIDHSGSMTGTGYAARDQWGSRYTVTRALLDTLYRMAPRTQVGLVVFREYLWYDKSVTNTIFSPHLRTLNPTRDNQPNQAFLAPLVLDSVYQGRRGIEIIKEAIRTDSAMTANPPHLALFHRPTFNAPGNTNINVAFLGNPAGHYRGHLPQGATICHLPLRRRTLGTHPGRTGPKLVFPGHEHAHNLHRVLQRSRQRPSAGAAAYPGHDRQHPAKRLFQLKSVQ